MAGVRHAGHAAEPGRDAGEQAADWEMAVHHVGALGADQLSKRDEGPDLRERRQGARHRHGDDAESLGAQHVEHRPVGADAHDLVPPVAQPAHQRQHELPQRKVDVGDLQDFHAGGTLGAHIDRC